VGHAASIYDTLLAAPTFAINVLSDTQEQTARRFAETGVPRFTGIGFTRGQTGAPLIDDALATLECRHVANHEAGDHTLMIGETVAASIRDAKPLLYYRGGFAQLE
jgi:flavin reductase (DIM6/NTAB) family NADH-FMN oxidoreductase RutF